VQNPLNRPLLARPPFQKGHCNPGSRRPRRACRAHCNHDLATPYFLKPLNIFNVLRGMSTIGVMAIGVTMIIITGGIDLSVGSVLAVAACSRRA